MLSGKTQRLSECGKTELILQVRLHTSSHHSEDSVLCMVVSTLESGDVAPPGDIVVLAHSLGGGFDY